MNEIFEKLNRLYFACQIAPLTKKEHVQLEQDYIALANFLKEKVETPDSISK